MHPLRLGAHAALVGLLALGACSSEPVEPGGPAADASIRVSANVSNTPIDLLVVTVSAGDLPVAAVFNLPVQNGTASGTIRIPPGTARLFTVEAFDPDGEVTHDGAATRDVQRGPNPPLAIPLTPRSGQVPLTITFGDYSVEVSPATAEIDLEVEPTVQLSVVVEDAEGNLVAGPEVQWATTNPGRATVSSTGLVTGHLPGTVDIVATYNGIAGVTHVTLLGAAPDTYYADADDDGFGDPAASVAVPTGSPAPAGYVADGSDCDDTDNAKFPGANEIWNGYDDDCDGNVDEGIPIATYVDSDEDGYGSSSALAQFVMTLPGGVIEPAPGYVLIAGDCNDANAAINPAAIEIAGDGVDSDCDGIID
ncbi:MAG TPA: MopE-related protein [Gemmatimonadales bacterium]